ncbi:MAG: hypothetical protein M1546_10015 [Chloroflexi bacterium]|nr:hypothetical protein [Chloroflexota bacterium]
MLKRRLIPTGLAIAALLLGTASTASAVGTSGEQVPPDGKQIVVKVTAYPGVAQDKVKAAGMKQVQVDDAIVEQCKAQVAPNLDTQARDTMTPEIEAQLRAAKQALGDCVQKATLAAMTPEERTRMEAQQRADDALRQKCISQVAPDLASAAKDQAQLTPEQARQRVADKMKVGVCMGKLTPEQAAQAIARQQHVQTCVLQVAPELAAWNAAKSSEMATPEQVAQLRAAKQRVADCVDQGVPAKEDPGAKP